MWKKTTGHFIAVVAISALFAHCDCNSNGGKPDGSDLDGGPDGSVICLDTGVFCQPGQAPACCSGICLVPDGGIPVCGDFVLCSDQGAACTQPTDCCSLQCVGGTCGGMPCAQIGTACSSGAECCSGTCTSSLCAKIPGSTCKNLGEACAAGTDCCSWNCQGTVCVRASGCSAGGDICYQALDCCDGVCQLTGTAGTPGTCAVNVTVPGATQCVMAGEPCADSIGCCSHLCLDLGSGQATCVLGSGCRERGELCGKTADCCGATTSKVVCELATQDPPIGRCTNKQGCQPVGNCCGAFGSNCEQACCDGQKEVCRQDSSGISRCFGGGSVCPNGYDGNDPNCCIKNGDACQFRDQCCDFSPCIQVNGQYVCQAPVCVPPGADCTPGADTCCDGLSCLPNGEVGNVCRQPTTTPDGGMPDGGDSAPCQPDQTNCTSASQCCSGICSGGLCVPPQTCVSEGGTCSGTAECCTGLVCNIPAGQANGTCQTGSTCASAGQACSTTSPCCARLVCDNAATGAACAPGDSYCVCDLIPT